MLSKQLNVSFKNYIQISQHTYRLPGEAQKIDRMMESFAQRYCTLNPNIFTNSDTCYVLSFAVIMLNT